MPQKDRDDAIGAAMFDKSVRKSLESAEARRKKALASIQNFGKIAIVKCAVFPALPDTGPPSMAGFVFLDGVNLHGRPHAGGTTNQL